MFLKCNSSLFSFILQVLRWLIQPFQEYLKYKKKAFRLIDWALGLAQARARLGSGSFQLYSSRLEPRGPFMDILKSGLTLNLIQWRFYFPAFGNKQIRSGAHLMNKVVVQHSGSLCAPHLVAQGSNLINVWAHWLSINSKFNWQKLSRQALMGFCG